MTHKQDQQLNSFPNEFWDYLIPQYWSLCIMKKTILSLVGTWPQCLCQSSCVIWSPTSLHQNSSMVFRPRSKIPLLDLQKGIMVSYNMAIYDLALTTFRLITCFELLNQWYKANLGIQEFKVLYRAHKNYDGYYYFTTRPSLIWEPYILDVPW